MESPKKTKSRNPEFEWHMKSSNKKSRMRVTSPEDSEVSEDFRIRRSKSNKDKRVSRKSRKTRDDDEASLQYVRRQPTYETLFNLPGADSQILARCPKGSYEKEEDDVYENVSDNSSLTIFPWEGGLNRHDSEKHKLLVTYYLGEMTREKAERFCSELGCFKLYHRMPSAKRIVMLLPLFIVYRTSRGKLCHYRVLPVDSNLRVDLPNQPIFSSLSQLVFHYSTYATCDSDGFADSFPWWMTKDNYPVHSHIYK